MDHSYARIYRTHRTWIDAADELRLGWYRNINPWIAGLPPEDEVAHLAYAMGYLGLLIRDCPSLVAAERAKFAATLQQLSKETTGALNTTAAYHQKLEDRLNNFGAEISAGLKTDAFSATVADNVRDHFRTCGTQQAARSLKEEADGFQAAAVQQAKSFSILQQKMDDTGKHAEGSLREVNKAIHRINESVRTWSLELDVLRWSTLGIVMLIGALIGAFFMWCAVHLVPTDDPPPAAPIEKSAPVKSPLGSTKHAQK